MPDLPAEVDVAFLRERLTRAVARVCPHWLADQREDIVQVSVMRLLDRLARPEETGPLTSSYVWRVAFSVTVDEIRRVRRRRETSIDGEPRQDWPAAGADPERSMQTRQVGAAIHRTACRALACRVVWRLRPIFKAIPRVKPAVCSAGRRSECKTSCTAGSMTCGSVLARRV